MKLPFTLFIAAVATTTVSGCMPTKNQITASDSSLRHRIDVAVNSFELHPTGAIWMPLDERSLAVQDASSYVWIVDTGTCPGLENYRSVSFTTHKNLVRAGTDALHTGGSRTCMIEKIYPLGRLGARLAGRGYVLADERWYEHSILVKD